MRLAWFSPLPPAGSGIAAYSADLLPELERHCTIDCYCDPHGAAAVPGTAVHARPAHEFVWRHRRQPYDLIVYQLGNAAWHDHMWAYLANYPGLAVLHDARLHHARARQLLRDRRFEDYRREFRYDNPGAPRDVTEYAVEGLGGPIYYLWRLIAAVVRTARGVAVHNPRVAADLASEFPDRPIDAIRMGVPALTADPAAGAWTRQELGIASDTIVFAAFGKVTAEKRIGPIARAMAAMPDPGPRTHLLLIGDTSGHQSLKAEIAAAGLAGRVTVTGEVPDADLARYLAAADVCLCLRWPTAEETSASWLRCLAARRATVISDLPHLADVPVLAARGWRQPPAGVAPVAIAIDLVEEQDSLIAAMTRLAGDAALRDAIAAAGHAYWAANHRLELMADDYRALIARVAERPAPVVTGLPFHWTDDYSTRAREIAAQFGVDVDILRRP